MFYCSISSTSWKRIKALLFLMILIAEFISESGGVDVESFLLDKDEDDESDDRRVGGAHIFNKKTRRLLLRLFRRRIKIPEKSSLSLATQVSRPNIFPGLFNQEDGFITDAVVEVPLWLDLDDFAEAMYAINSTGHAKAAGFIGTERCFLYAKLEWLLGLVAQLSEKVAHTCLLKFVCETQSIHTFYPDYPISIAFELIHLLLTPSSGTDDPCFQDYVVAENKGKMYGRCDRYDSGCPLSVGGVLIHNFFPEIPTTSTMSATPPPPPVQNSERFMQLYSMFKHLL